MLKVNFFGNLYFTDENGLYYSLIHGVKIIDGELWFVDFMGDPIK